MANATSGASPEVGRGAANTQSAAFYALQMLDRGRQLGYRGTTLACRESHLRLHILPLVGARKASSLTRSDSLALLDHLRSQSRLRSPNSILGVFRTWRALLWQMRDADVPLPANILSRVGLPQQRRPGGPLFCTDKVAEVAASMRGAAPRYEIGIWLAACAGLRIGEVLGLTWDNIDLEQNRLSVTQQLFNREIRKLKTRASYATLPVDRFLVDKLQEHRERFSADSVNPRYRTSGNGSTPQGDWVILNSWGRPLRNNYFYKCWNSALPTASLPSRVPFHGLRHYYISILAESGKYSPTTIQALARHGCLKSTLSYMHLLDDPDVKGVNVFSTALG
ncbi:tyrosine-type recombinase/integrase [Streptomyces umbrinus]|uniref:tyrosine-type recombinase/integrase n=1 Tax=Streptomyces umbrinus TaxID=67370 RepID=UPI0033EB477F